MARIDGKCIGDCSRCELLANGDVDMIPCILDQIFSRVRKTEKEVSEMRKSISDNMADKQKIQLVELEEDVDEASSETEESE